MHHYSSVFILMSYICNMHIEPIACTKKDTFRNKTWVLFTLLNPFLPSLHASLSPLCLCRSNVMDSLWVIREAYRLSAWVFFPTCVWSIITVGPIALSSSTTASRYPSLLSCKITRAPCDHLKFEMVYRNRDFPLTIQVLYQCHMSFIMAPPL